jgi:hypothetical protein
MATLSGSVEDQAKTITLAVLLAAGNEADVDGTVTGFKVTTIASGTLKVRDTSKGTVTAAVAGVTVIDATHELIWTPDPNANGSGLDAFKVVAVDDLGVASSPPVTVKLDVQAVDDPPVNTVPGVQTVSEDGTRQFKTGNPNNPISVSDVDDANLTVTLSVQHGTVSLSPPLDGITGNGTAWVTITGSVTHINDALNGMVYKPAPNFSGSDTLRIDSFDETTHTLSDIVINVTPVNDPPAITGDLSATVLEGSTIALTTSDLGFADPDDGASDVLFTVSDLVHGTMKVNGSVRTTFTGTELVNGLVAFHA